MARQFSMRHPAFWLFIFHGALRAFSVQRWSSSKPEKTDKGWVLVARAEGAAWIVLAVLGSFAFLVGAILAASSIRNNEGVAFRPALMILLGAVGTYIAVRQLRLEVQVRRTELWVSDWPLPSEEVEIKLRKRMLVHVPVECVEAELILMRKQIVRAFGKRRDFQRSVIAQTISVSPSAQFPELDVSFKVRVTNPKDDPAYREWTLLTTVRRKDGGTHRALFELVVA